MQTKESVGLSFQYRFSVFYIENYELRQGSDLPAVITAWEPPLPPPPPPICYFSPHAGWWNRLIWAAVPLLTDIEGYLFINKSLWHDELHKMDKLQIQLSETVPFVSSFFSIQTKREERHTKGGWRKKIFRLCCARFRWCSFSVKCTYAYYLGFSNTEEYTKIR